MKTTEITVNAECPGCGKACPPKLGIPGGHQYGWQWDGQTEQRWCRACHESLEAKRHFVFWGWVWKVTYHSFEGDHSEYCAELTDWHESNVAWGRATTTIVFDPDQVVLPPEDSEEFQERVEKMVDDLEAKGVTLPIMSLDADAATALQEETGIDD